MRRIAVAVAVLISAWIGAGQALVSKADDEGATEPLVAGFELVPGFDISWPQCGKDYPPGPVSFAVIGINNGKPFTANPCFLHQYQWAQRVEKSPAVYVNTAFPKPGESMAVVGPYGACLEDDGWCRGYNYGWNLAKDVITKAEFMRVTPSHWWLDVEGGNFWSGDVQNNSQVIRGAIEYFKQRGLPVGIYGTPYQWRNIAGTWASPGIPIWTAGAQGIEMAASRCDPNYAFAGGVVVMVQYYDWGFDTNYICPGTEKLIKHPEPLPLAGGPRGRTGSLDGLGLPYWHVLPLVSN
ncbi:MAG: hypothetical protein ABI577_14720 [bacterium]